MKYSESYLRQYFDEIDWNDYTLHRDSNISKDFLIEFESKIDLKEIIDWYCFSLFKAKKENVWEDVEKIMYRKYQMNMPLEEVYMNIKREKNFEV